MNYIVGSKDSGKTRKLLELAKQENALFICRNPLAMARKAEAYGITGLQFISFEEVEYNGVIIEDKFVVDEVSDFLAYFLTSNCIGFTQTQPEEPVQENID